MENNVDMTKNNLDDSNNNDTASQSNQDEWIVEKILGIRIAKRSVSYFCFVFLFVIIILIKIILYFILLKNI